MHVACPKTLKSYNSPLNKLAILLLQKLELLQMSPYHATAVPKIGV